MGLFGKSKRRIAKGIEADLERQEKELQEFALELEGLKRDVSAYAQKCNPQKTTMLSAIASGYEFESYIATLLLKNGFGKAETTQKSGDYGADVLAERDGIKYAIQCKLYSSPVGIDAVQQAHSAKSYYNCDVAVVATNSTFTKAACEMADKSNVKLWDREKILSMDPCANATSSSYVTQPINLDDLTDDELYLKAVECVLTAGEASTSLIQRRLKLGYARSVQLLEIMEQNRIIGPRIGTFPRDVMITMDDWLRMGANK